MSIAVVPTGCGHHYRHADSLGAATAERARPRKPRWAYQCACGHKAASRYARVPAPLACPKCGARLGAAEYAWVRGQGPGPRQLSQKDFIQRLNERMRARGIEGLPFNGGGKARRMK